jgi:hypothetical protein
MSMVLGTSAAAPVGFEIQWNRACYPAITGRVKNVCFDLLLLDLFSGHFTLMKICRSSTFCGRIFSNMWFHLTNRCEISWSIPTWGVLKGANWNPLTSLLLEIFCTWSLCRSTNYFLGSRTTPLLDIVCTWILYGVTRASTCLVPPKRSYARFVKMTEFL